MNLNEYIIKPQKTKLDKKEIKNLIAKSLQDIYNGKTFDIENFKELISFAKDKKIDIEKIDVEYYWQDDFYDDDLKFSPLKYATYNFFANEKDFAEVLPYLLANVDTKKHSESIENSLGNMFDRDHGDDLKYVYKGIDNLSPEFLDTFNMLKENGAKMNLFNYNIYVLGHKHFEDPKFVDFLLSQNDPDINISLSNNYYEAKDYKAYYQLLKEKGADMFSSTQAISKLDGTSKRMPQVLYLLEVGEIDIKDFNQNALDSAIESLNIFHPLDDIMFTKRFKEIKSQYQKLTEKQAKYSHKKSLSLNNISTSSKENNLEM